MAEIPPLPAPAARFVDEQGRPTTEFYVFLNKIRPLLELADTALQTTAPPDPNILYRNATANLTAGYTATSFNAGTKSSGTFTPAAASGALQYYVNGGAHTLGKPTADCSILIKITNNASAGAINTSAFAKVRGSFTTTNGAVFLAGINVVDGTGFLNIM